MAFEECPACAAKLGSPYLCEDCLNRRSAHQEEMALEVSYQEINSVERLADQLGVSLERIRKVCDRAIAFREWQKNQDP